MRHNGIVEIVTAMWSDEGRLGGMALLEYDPGCNSLYIRVEKGEVAESEPVSDNVIIDLDEEGRILGIEILGSNPIDLKKFSGQIEILTK